MELQEIETKIKELSNAKDELLRDQRKIDALNSISSDENGNLVLNIWARNHFFNVENLLTDLTKDGCAISPLYSSKEKDYLTKFKITVERI